MNTSSTAPGPAGDALNDAERRLLQAAATGQLVDLRSGNTELDNPDRASEWGDDRTIRAGFLAELIIGEREAEGGLLRAVKLRGARIIGQLDLEARTLLCPLLFRDCAFEKTPNLSEATAVAIRLPGCHLPALHATQLRTSGNVELNNGFRAADTVYLIGARIGGQLNLSGAILNNGNGTALDGNGLTVDQGMACMQGFTAHGEVKLAGARIGGQLNLTGAVLDNENGTALDGNGLTVERDMVCTHGFRAHGVVKLAGARIGGQLNLTGAVLDNENGTALDGNGLTVDRDMVCTHKFTAHGEIRLLSAHIGGEFDLSYSTLANEGRNALKADAITIGQGLTCRWLRVRGEICLLGANIGGQFSLSGTILTNEGGKALSADGATIGGGVFCRHGFAAHGEVRFLDAHIALLELDGATLTNDGGIALNAARVTIDEYMSCDDKFTAHGDIHLLGAHIGGELSLRGASLTGSNTTTLNLERATIGTLLLLPSRAPDGAMDLTNTHVGSFLDDRATWAAAIYLRGFVYDSLENDAVSVRDRLGWLARNPAGFTPQVYDQLASAYRRAGQEGAARRVAITKQWRSRQRWNPLNWLLYATVGYGYRNWLAAVWLAVLTVLGSLVFGSAHMTPLTAHPPAFYPVIYTVDALLPIVDLGQQSSWQAHGAALYVSWFLISAGWVLTTAVIAGLAGLLQRDSPRL